MLLLAGGLQTNEVACALFITELTVRTHVKQALRHCRAHSREEVYRLLELAQGTNAVRLASRRVRPFHDQWLSREAPSGNGPIPSQPLSGSEKPGDRGSFVLQDNAARAVRPRAAGRRGR